MSSPSGPSPEIISVLVADSNQTQSQLLCSALRRQGMLRVSRCQADLPECLSEMDDGETDVLLLADGLTENRQRLYELLRGVHSAHPNAAIVLLLDNYDRELVVNSLRAGARGLFCLASLPFRSLCRCIASVHQGQYWTNTEQMRFIIDALSTGPAAHLVDSRGDVLLTPREEQTVNLVAEGLNNREIAQQLNLKENTVKKSLLRVYDKLGVSNRVELVLYAVSHWQERASDDKREPQNVTSNSECELAELVHG
jgi:DNA-binding NarL/FixJ family response regulator